ncbi:ABC transporter permease [Candidatus Thorarchaeota archaeon]|nr:MAG: ABC transporter permease [Candidatus Thorarchaeota archaeon]
MSEEIVISEEKTEQIDFVSTIINKIASPQFQKTIGHTIISILMALFVAAIIMIATGYDPGSAFASLGLGALLNFDQVLWKSTPLLLAGLSVALAFKCGLFNIGAEGQLYMGSIAATAVGYMIALPLGIHIFACIAVGVIAGLLYGLLPGILRAYRGAHEVVTTMMLSYAAVKFTQWLVSEGPMHNPGDSRSVTPFILPTAQIDKLLGSPFLSWAFIIALLCVPLVNFFINKTVMGYEMRAVGQNEDAARTAGIDAKKNMALALGLSGGLAGLAGTLEIQGYYHRFYDGWSAGLGFDGITVAVLGRNNPWGVLGGALFFGALKAGGSFMQTNADVPSEMVQVIQGLVVLFVAAPRLVDWLSKNGVGYASWIKNNPKAGLASLLSLGYGMLGTFLGVIVTSSVIGTNFTTLLLGLVVSIGSLLIVIFNLKRDERRTSLTSSIAIMWFIMLLIGISLQVSSIIFTALLLGIIGFIIGIMLSATKEDVLLEKEVVV